jgi:hypothetical protein
MPENKTNAQFSIQEKERLTKSLIKRDLTGSRMCIRCGHQYERNPDLPRICDCKNPFTVPAELVTEFSVEKLQKHFYNALNAGIPKHLFNLRIEDIKCVG